MKTLQKWAQTLPEWMVQIGLLLILISVPTVCAVLFFHYRIWTNFQIHQP